MLMLTWRLNYGGAVITSITVIQDDSGNKSSSEHLKSKKMKKSKTEEEKHVKGVLTFCFLNSSVRVDQ